MALRENRLIRLPVTQEIAGSSPARVAMAVWCNGSRLKYIAYLMVVGDSGSIPDTVAICAYGAIGEIP